MSKIVAYFAIYFYSAFVIAGTPEDLKLVGQIVGDQALTASEVAAIEPACKVIGMGKIDGVFWAEGMNKNGQVALLNQPEYAMAKGASFFHHYCWGKLAKNRYFSQDLRFPHEFYLRKWKEEMAGVIDFAKKHNPSWEFIPHTYKELGEAYYFEKSYGQAIIFGQKALELKPDFLPAYTLVAQSYEAIGDRQKALAAVTEGLKHEPKSKGLQRRYTELGGKQPFPIPYQKQEVQTPSGDTISEEEIADPNKGKTDPTATESTLTSEPEKIGVPGNPYCRFCP